MKKYGSMFVAVIALAVFAGAATASPVSRQQAIRTAHDYLSSEAFSYSGLIEQLKYEGYSRTDAAYAASHSGANWYQQAAKDAREYLSSEGFSRSGLIGQLEYEGFTPAQAIYGVNRVGL